MTEKKKSAWTSFVPGYNVYKAVSGSDPLGDAFADDADGGDGIPRPRPVHPAGQSSAQVGYGELMQKMLAEGPGQGYDQTKYYQKLQDDVTARMRDMRWREGAQRSRAGAVSYGDYGAARSAGTRQATAENTMRLGADSQARQAHVTEQVQYFDQLLRAAQYEGGIQNQQFQQELQAEFLRYGGDMRALEVMAQRNQIPIDFLKSLLGLAGALGGAAIKSGAV